MPSGHTDQATINKRRPLTERQIALLDRLVVGPIPDDNQNTPQKNVLRSLNERGLVESSYSPVRKRVVWRITPDGWNAVCGQQTEGGK